MHAGERTGTLFRTWHGLAVLAGLGRSDRNRKFYREVGQGLIAFAGQEFRGSAGVATGGTERDHEDAAARIRAGLPGGRNKPAAPERLKCPAPLAYLWNRFVEIMEGASGGGMGPATITWTDLAAWGDLTGEAQEPWECRLLMRLSVLRAEIASEGQHAGQGEDRSA